MHIVRWKILILLFCLPGRLPAQQIVGLTDSVPVIRILSTNPGVYKNKTGDTVWIYSGLCKTLQTTVYTGRKAIDLISNRELSNRHLLLKVEGEASYQHFQRKSGSDNLLLINSTADLAALRLSLVYKETYPVSFYFRYNSSSPFQLDNQYEFNISFDDRNYKEILRSKVVDNIKARFIQKQLLLQQQYENLFRQFQEQKEVLQSPAYLQQQVQNRFQGEGIDGASRTPGISSMPDAGSADSLTNRFSFIRGFPASLNKEALGKPEFLPEKQIADRLSDTLNTRAADFSNEFYARLVRRKDSLQGMMKKYEDSIAVYKNKLGEEMDSVNKELAELKTNTQIENYKKRKGLNDTVMKSGWPDFLIRTNIRFGKFILNGSELTVNNIFLHGASIKYGDEKFVQLYAGYYDFAFREMFHFRRDSTKGPRQSVFGLRIGKTDGKNLQAVNLYAGRKQKPGSINGQLYTVAGISFERRIYFNKNIEASLELAKSTTKYSNNITKESSPLKDLFGSLSGKTIGSNLSARVYLPGSKTDAEISYKYLGQQFESFNASQYFNPQSNLSLRLNQPLFKRRLILSSGIKYTDFRSYGISSNLKSKTLFASLNATLRVKKLPVVSLGYYPGSQLYWMEGNRLYEYFYYIMNVTASHYFIAGKLPMQAVFTYNKFFNRYTDSLVNGSQSFYSFFWNTWAGKFGYQLNYSRQVTAIMKLSTIEAGINYSGNKLKIGGTLKLNSTGKVTKMGYTSNMGLFLNKIGTVSFIYDRSFLPERTGVVIPVTTGQIQIIKPLKFRIWQKG